MNTIEYGGRHLKLLYIVMLRRLKNTTIHIVFSKVDFFLINIRYDDKSLEKKSHFLPPFKDWSL